MHWPYTKDWLDAFMAAQLGAALMLTAVILYGPLRRPARWLLLGGVWLSAAALMLPSSLEELSFRPGPGLFRAVLLLCAGLGTSAAIVSMRPRVIAVALLGHVPLWLLTGFLKDSDAELAALHLAWLGLIAGVLGRRASPPTVEPPKMETETEPSYFAHDAAAFVVSVSLAALMCVTVMHRRDGSADEWGYTFQAAVFASGRLYAHVPRCWHFLENFYVFESSGRLFSQYTPGWPMFLAPFVWIRAVWLGAPVSLGLLALGMARLGRSAMRGSLPAGEPRPSSRIIRLTGTWAVVMVLGTSLITNAASRYAHVYVLALYAWSLEALVQVTTPGLSRRRQILWGVVLGTATLHTVAVRPADGAFAGIGIATIFAIALARRRVTWRATAWATAAFAFWALVVLVILRVQVGRWFATGYALNSVLRPWNTLKFTWPSPGEWKYGLPLATGAYCWWPASIALGLAGLARVRGRARELVVALALSCIPYSMFNMVLDVRQRGGTDWGYGPRYLMLLVVPAALGGAVALAPLTVAAVQRSSGGRTALARGAPLALAMFAVVAMWLRIVPPEWATVAEHTFKHSVLRRAIESAHLKNAVVVARGRPAGFMDLDLPTNLPLDLYPDQDAVIAIDRGQPREADECLKAAFPGRQLYHASAGEDPSLRPAD